MIIDYFRASFGRLQTLMMTSYLFCSVFYTFTIIFIQQGLDRNDGEFLNIHKISYTGSWGRISLNSVLSNRKK